MLINRGWQKCVMLNSLAKLSMCNFHLKTYINTVKILIIYLYQNMCQYITKNNKIFEYDIKRQIVK